MARTDTALHALTPIAGYRQVPASDVKAWAADNGFTVHNGRGAMPREVINAYNAAHVRNRRQYVVASKVQPVQTFNYTTASDRQGKFTAAPAAVRSWAQDNGLKVGARGRFSAEVLDAYGQAHAKSRKSKPAPAADAAE